MTAPAIPPRHATKLIPSNPPAGVPAHYLQQYYAALGKLSVAFQWFTPAEARWLLAHRNNRNRPLRSSWRVLRQKIAAQLFRSDNGETAIFSSDGEVLSAQHRLRAIAEGDHPVMLLCVYGVDVEAFSSLDQGAKRNCRDVLSLMGEEEASVLAGALNWANRYAGGGVDKGQWRALPNEQVSELVELYPGLRDSVAYAVQNHGAKGNRPFTKPVLAFLHYAMMEFDPEFAQAFLRRTARGIEVPELSWEYALRRRLLDEFGGRGHYLDMVHVIALTFKAFNYSRAGRPVIKPVRRGKEYEHTVVWKPEVEAFPQLGEV